MVFLLEDAKFCRRAQSRPQPIGSNSTWVLSVDDCAAFTEKLCADGVTIIAGPTQQPRGLETVIDHPYGKVYLLVRHTAIRSAAARQAEAENGDAARSVDHAGAAET